MRKAQKQLLLDLTQTLFEAHGTVNRYINGKHLENARMLIEACQNSAIRMGESIEQSEGEDCSTVSLLEKYCETLFQIYHGISSASNGTTLFKTLNKSLMQVKKSIKSDLKVRLEIVFLPYKASMWDSFESVWKAADNDPDCDAYVVPIPYYDRNSDYSFGAFHYESAEYPAYVPVVHYEAYDLEQRRPDVVFICNPYDEGNLVTSVEPKFYAKELKKYTDMLAYIPYFVISGELTPHFATLPAVLCSDFTIVESEAVRQQYLDVWAGMVKEKKASLAHLELLQKKILPLGSPKFDAVRMRRADENMPDDWKRLILLPNGTRKKVIFYNTSIHTLLLESIDRDKISEKYLDKLESVLRFFKERSDVVLLWRPHPLLESTIASMRPQLLLRYKQLVQDYKKAGYGIFDESGDLHRAIAVADAYYGDTSSVTGLWKKTGKPCLISNVNITSYEQRIVARNLYFDGESLWCTALNFNGLFRIEPDTLKMHYVGAFPQEKEAGYFLFNKIAQCKEKLYFAPYNAENIGVYDKRTGKLSSIPIPSKKKEEEQCEQYVGVFVYDDGVFITGGRKKYILRVDTHTEKVEVLDVWENQLLAHRDEKSVYFFSHGCQSDNILYIPSQYTNAMCIFRMKEKNLQVHPFLAENRYYGQSAYLREKIWLCSASEPFIGVYDIMTGTLSEIDARFLSVRGFHGIRSYAGYLICFSRERPGFLKIDPHTYKMQWIERGQACDAVASRGCFVYSISCFTGKIAKLNLETMDEQMADMLCETPGVDERSVLTESEAFNKLALENAYLSLNTVVNLVKTRVSTGIAEGTNYGEHIYQNIKGEILCSGL